VSAYFQTEGEKRVLLALIQGGDLGGGTVQIRIRFDPSQVLVADTWEDDPACLDPVIRCRSAIIGMRMSSG
jgi:hypothetical protein